MSEYFYRPSHCRLYMDRLYVVPSFLKQGAQEVERHDDVLSDLLVGHFLVGDGDVHVGDLLQLPLNRGLHVIKLLVERLLVSDWSRESTDSVKNWTEDNWNLLNEGISGEQKIELLGPLLDEFLVLIELLQVVQGGDLDGAAFHTIAECLGFILMLLIGDKADLHIWSWDVWKLDGTSEPLILLWIVILKSNLELNSLLELSPLSFASHLGDAFENTLVCDLTHFSKEILIINF